MEHVAKNPDPFISFEQALEQGHFTEHAHRQTPGTVVGAGVVAIFKGAGTLAYS